MLELIGLIGLVLIVIAWIPETIKTLKKLEKPARIEFLMLYFFGSILLTMHAITIRDPVFITLNGIASILSGINFGKALVLKGRK
ncbi:MAG: hypothetical protein NDP13_04250 [Crenarchaeota archaeon]|nr:hypothetical protein [Thermoproteota archaeon]MCR8454184.1 hypothetical protein [Thermoproteota archaeon]MCR8455584.1 hypothetical protein [Thermoproteota archaeon]MCR8463190.1 hypothetical protein [Thermoproteota archaeon]MCR8470565.1 hypothetical protein [Thermoproteota archaeon]